MALATTANVAETPVVLLNEDHNESSGDTGGFFPFLNIAHLVKIILTINWMSKVDKIINQDENTFLCLFSKTKYISAIIRMGMDKKEWIQNFDLPTHLLVITCVRWSFMGKLLLTRPLKLICSAEPRTWRLGVASPTQEVDTKPRDALPWPRTYVRHLCAACFNAKLAAFSRKILMFHSHCIALIINVGRCKCVHDAMIWK